MIYDSMETNYIISLTVRDLSVKYYFLLCLFPIRCGTFTFFENFIKRIGKANIIGIDEETSLYCLSRLVWITPGCTQNTLCGGNCFVWQHKAYTGVVETYVGRR